MHPRRHYPDVQDSSAQLPDFRLGFECSISTRNQVWRLPSHSHWNAHVRLLLMYFSSTSKSCFTVLSHRVHSLMVVLVSVACGQAIEGTTSEQYLQRLRRVLHSPAIRDPRRRLPISHRFVRTI